MKLIIFDFDGVLRKATFEQIYDAYKKTIKAVGKEPDMFFVDVDSFRKWYDIDWHKNEMQIFGNDEYVPSPDFDRIFHENFDPTLALFPWVPDTLAHLSQKYILAIFSSSMQSSIKNALGDLSEYFSFIIGAGEVTSLKPNPEGILLALTLANVSASEAIMIGDMNVDFLAGKSAGIKTCLVKWGIGDWEELIALKPDYLFEKPEDLLSL